MEEWLVAAGVTQGKIFRRVNKMDRRGARGSPKRLFGALSGTQPSSPAPEAGAPRPTSHLCSALSRAGGELEQIQFLLGHVSIQTTERYLGCKQRIRSAVNDESGSNSARPLHEVRMADHSPESRR